MNLEIYFARLKADDQEMREFALRCPRMQYQRPSPDQARVTLQVPAHHRFANGDVRVVESGHVARFRFPLEYPLQRGPVVQMEPPGPGVRFFHPNIVPDESGGVCMGLDENWAPGLSMPYLVLMLTRILRLEIYNTMSVLDGDAAEFVLTLAAQRQLPLDSTPLTEGSDPWPATPVDVAMRCADAQGEMGERDDLETEDDWFEEVLS